MKTIIVAMSATDSVHIIRELQRLVTNDGRVEHHIRGGRDIKINRNPFWPAYEIGGE